MSDVQRTFEEDVKINRFELELGSEEQPSFYQYWADKLADAKFEKDKLSNKLDILKAEKDLFYRANPLEGNKVTESSIKAMIDSDQEIIEIKKELNNNTKKVNILSGRVASLEHRKSELKNLTNLWIAGYYSFPDGRKTSTDDIRETVRNQINKKTEV